MVGWLWHHELRPDSARGARTSGDLACPRPRRPGAPARTARSGGAVDSIAAPMVAGLPGRPHGRERPRAQPWCPRRAAPTGLGRCDSAGTLVAAMFVAEALGIGQFPLLGLIGALVPFILLQGVATTLRRPRDVAHGVLRHAALRRDRRRGRTRRQWRPGDRARRRLPLVGGARLPPRGVLAAVRLTSHGGRGPAGFRGEADSPT
jgi:hypothetical protein